MAVIKKAASSLAALTATALALPGLLSSVVAHAAEGDEVDFQYSHYQEGKRNIAITNGVDITKGKSFNPIEVDSLHGSSRISLTDRVKFAFNYLQDTWGGATPTATMPFVAEGANLALFGNKANTGTVVGASPIVIISRLPLDSQLNPVSPTGQFDPITGIPIYTKNRKSSQLTHVMATASPETRKQGDFKLSYDWDNAAVSVGGGVSIEDDYDSRFGNIGSRFDFNQKRTTVTADLSYTNSYTHAILDHDTYVKDTLIPASQIDRAMNGDNSWNLVHGTRQDWSTHLGLTQVLNKNALIGADFNYTRSTGYLSNPYKGVSIVFVDPGPNGQIDAPPGGFMAGISTYYEKRPDVRNLYSVGGRYAQFFEALDASLHFNYQFSADDWGIQAHTFDADWIQPLGSGWTVTPHVRYYSQDAAFFYTPYLLTQQAEAANALDANGNQLFVGSDGNQYALDFSKGGFVDAKGNPAPPSVTFEPKTVPFDSKKLPASYSSDQRLSGFGTLSGGVTLTKQFAKGFTLETGFEYYTHQGGLKLGGNGEGNFADFDYWTANAALKVNLAAIGENMGTTNHSHPINHSHGNLPAGIMFGHTLHKAGQMMVGYRYKHSMEGGDLLHGTQVAHEQTVIDKACKATEGCTLFPRNMTMNMHMLDLMYAPTDWLTLMLMPQFMDMDMALYRPASLPPPDHGTQQHNHGAHGHETGGVGDTGMYALVKLFDDRHHHLHAGLGFTAPTGDSNIKLKETTKNAEGAYIHYGMQLGSGTWDFKPSITYTGESGAWLWGMQIAGTKRMENNNASGYALGDVFESSVWGGYGLTDWLSGSVRLAYTWQGRITGKYPRSTRFDSQLRDCKTEATYPDVYDENGNPGPPVFHNDLYQDCLLSNAETKRQNDANDRPSPMDSPSNYGGHYLDLGFGISATVPEGAFAGNQFAFEWLQPVYTDVNGYQLDREGNLSFTWSYGF